MSFRPRHLACLLLLLSSLAAASAQPAREEIFKGRYIDVLLLRHAAEAARAAEAEHQPQTTPSSRAIRLPLSASQLQSATTVWDVAAPAAQAASIYAHTATARP